MTMLKVILFIIYMFKYMFVLVLCKHLRTRNWVFVPIFAYFKTRNLIQIRILRGSLPS